MKNDAEYPKCGCEDESPRTGGITFDKGFFNAEPVTGYQLDSRFEGIYFNFDTTELVLDVQVHLVGIVTSGGADPEPVLDMNSVNSIFAIANNIWSQACIRLNPMFTNTLITEEPFQEMIYMGGYIGCLSEPNNALARQIIESYRVGGLSAVNLFILFRANIGCGSHRERWLFIATRGDSASTKNESNHRLGKLLAHELGHVLIQDAGFDNSNPDHLMNHSNTGTQDSLFYSDCMNARAWIKENVSHALTSNPCKLRPRLGNDFTLVSLNNLS